MERFGAGPGPSAAARSTVTQPVSGPPPLPARVGRPTSNGKSQFLRLEQPVVESVLPAQHLARQGCTYTVPFTFVVPAQLLPSACEHVVENAAVRDAHLLLPPSFGDPAAVGAEGGTGGSSDDLAPDMTRISYAVHARLLCRTEPAAGRRSPPLVLGEAVRPVAVVPAVPAAPPALVAATSRDFVLCREKMLRRGWLACRRLGRLTVRADQPPPLPTHPLPQTQARSGADAPPSTAVALTISFVPHEPHTPPPPLLRLAARLHSATFFSTTRMTYLPTVARSRPDPCVGNYSHAAALSSRCLAGVAWERVAPASGPGPIEYVATVRAPISAPKGKRLVPSFASCYAARAYTVELTLSVCTGGTAGKSSCSLRPLRLPLQVSCPLPGTAACGNPWKLADYDVDVDVGEYFTPRSVGSRGEGTSSGSGRYNGNGSGDIGNGSGSASGSGSGSGNGSGGSRDSGYSVSGSDGSRESGSGASGGSGGSGGSGSTVGRGPPPGYSLSGDSRPRAGS